MAVKACFVVAKKCGLSLMDILLLAFRIPCTCTIRKYCSSV